MIAFITFNSNLVPLLEGLCSSNPSRFEFSILGVFDTGVAQGSITPPQLFNIFINALLQILSATGQNQGISHGLQIGKDVDDSSQDANHGYRLSQVTLSRTGPCHERGFVVHVNVAVL